MSYEENDTDRLAQEGEDRAFAAYIDDAVAEEMAEHRAELDAAKLRIKELETLLGQHQPNIRQSLQCRTWLGGMIEETLRDDPDGWTFHEGDLIGGTSDHMKYRGTTSEFYKFWGWRLIRPSIKIPRHDRKVLRRLVKQVVKQKHQSARKKREAQEIKKFVEAKEK
jgi:hypothetical protein